MKENVDVYSWLKSKNKLGDGKKAAPPAQQIQQIPNPSKAASPPQNSAPIQQPPSQILIQQPPSQIPIQQPPSQKPIHGPPRPPPPPAPNIQGAQAAPDSGKPPPLLRDVKSNEELKSYVEAHGVRYYRTEIPSEVIKLLKRDIETIGCWESFPNRSEAVFGDTINFPKVGYSYGTPRKFYAARFWKPSMAQVASEIAVRFPNCYPPNLTPIIRYEAGQAFPPHKDRSPECKTNGYTIIVAIGPRDFKFSNQREKGAGYVECTYHMSDGDVLYIPKELHWGKFSCYHFTEKTDTQHFSVVLKNAKPPSLF